MSGETGQAAGPGRRRGGVSGATSGSEPLIPHWRACVASPRCFKEQILRIERFDTLEELRARIRAFARDFNERWLLERHGYRTPFRGLRAAPSGRGMIAVFTIKCPVNRVRRTSGMLARFIVHTTNDVSLPDGKAGYRIGLILHPHRDVSEGVERLCGWAGNHRTTVLVGAGDLPRVAAGVEPATDDELRGCDALVSLGGDGTMLGAMRLVADRPIPVLGVNFGTLGFLVEIEPPELPAALSRIAAGEATLELRSALRVTAGDTEVIAFNEVAVVRIPGEGFVHANLEVDGTRYGYYRADALIIATPTGSTAYSYAAGGPVLSPAAEGIVVTPASPMSGISRPLVLSADEAVRLELVDGSGSPAVEVDGVIAGKLTPGSPVRVAAQRDAAQIVRVDRVRHAARSRVKLSLLDLPLLPDELRSLDG